MTLEELKTKKIVILGLGANNQKLAEYLKKRRIGFEVFDNWSSPKNLKGLIDNFDVVFRTPGLPYLSVAIQQAKRRGVEIYSQTKLFFDLCPAILIGVTGTKGKGTTATLISKILEESQKKVWLAGNIGQDPFEFLDELKPSDFVVLELSSFQLQDLEKSPHVAVVLKITPEHLDHHETIDEYIDAKKPIILHQTEKDFAILNYDNEITRGFSSLTRAQIIWNSVVQEVRSGCFIEGDKIILDPALVNSEGEIMSISEVKLLGKFNLENVTAAIAAAYVAGARDIEDIRKAVSGFSGLPHRLEFVRDYKKVKFYNDSFSTTPETAIAAISAFEESLVLIVGGSKKNSDYSSLADEIARTKIKALLAIGLTGPHIARLARRAGYDGRILDEGLQDMEKIVSKANEIADPGDVVLLSPACASFDMFSNYKHRGELFKKFVNRL